MSDSGTVNLNNNVVKQLSAAFASIAKPGLAFQSTMAQLSIQSGITGKSLELMGNQARTLSKTFGTSAASSVEIFSDVVAKMGSKINQSPQVIEAMGKAAITLSKSMKGDVNGAIDALTTSMQAYQVSLKDPRAASGAMQTQINMLAQGAKLGSASIPQVANALKISGAAAYGAGVNFSEANAAIQVLAESGMYGAEAGTALQGVLLKLSQAGSIPQQSQDALKAAGVNMDLVSNASVPLASKLEELQKVQNNASLVAQVFGAENTATATTLITNTGLLKDWTAQMIGSSAAQDQAAIAMNTMGEKMQRYQAFVDNVKLSLFNLTGGVTGFLSVLGQQAAGVIDMIPAFLSLGRGIQWLTNVQRMQAVWSGICQAATVAWTGVQWALNVAMNANPIGLIVLGVGALVGVIALAWNKFAGFRAVIKTTWEAIKEFGGIIKTYVVDRIKGLLSGISGVGKAMGLLFEGEFSQAWQVGKQAVVDMSGFDATAKALASGSQVVKSVPGMFHTQLATEQAVETLKQNKKATSSALPVGPADIYGATSPAEADAGSGLGMSSTTSISAGATKSKQIKMNVGSLIGTMNITTSNMKEGAEKIRALVTDELSRLLLMVEANG